MTDRVFIVIVALVTAALAVGVIYEFSISEPSTCLDGAWEECE